MADQPLIVLGTHNVNKRDELADQLKPYGIRVATLAEFPSAIEVVEDGDTFAANSQKKAVEQAKVLGQWVLSDDSGIEVDALGGAPGVDSAHFAGPQRDNEANNQLLLEKLAGLPPAKRGAGYFCHVTLADPTGEIRAEATGRCRGVIVETPRGTGGFGYDPLFEVREYHRTFGEMGPEVKKALSHRSRAMRAIIPQLCRLLTAAATS